MKYLNYTLLSAPDTASASSAQLDSSQLVSISIQSIFGDITAAGSVKLQMSNDICPMNNLPSSFVVTNWSDIPSASATVAAGVCAPITLPMTLSYRWLRVVYTRVSGGSSTVTINVFAVSV